MKLYGEDVDISYEEIYYGYWAWPIAFNSEITETLYVLQELTPSTDDPTGTYMNEGLVSFDIDYELTRFFNTGKLYAEFKFKQQNSGTGNYLAQPIYTIITCLKIGNVKKSTTRDFLF